MMSGIKIINYRTEDHPDFWGVAPGKIIGLK